MKKIGKYLLVAIAILLVVLIVAPLLFKKQIVNQIKLMANKQLNATLNFNPDISLNLFSHFPHLSVVIRELTIVGKDDFAGDTLLDIKRLQAVVNLQSIWGKGPYEIRYVALDKPDLRLIVNRAGKANWDILNNSSSSSATASTPSAFRAALQRYVIREGSMQYADSTLNFYLSMQGLNHEGKGDFTQDVFNLQTQSHISSFTLVYDHIPYLHQVKADVQVNVHVDIPHQSYRFQQGTATLNGLTLLTEGEVRLPDSNQVYMDIHFRTAKTDFKQLLSLIPAIYTRNFAQLKASGTAVLSGDIKGSYQDNRIPAFHVQLQVQDGMFQYPSLPDALSHVQMQIQVNNDDGIVDHTIVNLQQLHLEMNQQPVDAHLLIRYPQSQMLIDGALHGKLDLASISRIYPLQTHTKLGGTLDADVQIKGSLEALQHKQYSQFQAKGYILANQIHYQSADFPQGISISDAQLMFSPQQVTLTRLQAMIGKSDIQAQGKLNQFYTYVFGKGPLEADLHVQSQLLDLNALMDSSSRPQADTLSAVKAVVIPRNMQLHITADIAHFIY
ncbi:MAG: AsmA family protein, partial [Thermoflavifilum sp.]|nr:AsmA family protein [Thermoflavifilum sp.]